MNATDIVGWIFNGEYFCCDCSPTNDEGESSGQPIFADSETDCPNHCCSCEELIKEVLTSAGVDYVAEKFQDFLIKRDGRADILRQWTEEYKGCWANYEQGERVRDLVESACQEENVLHARRNILNAILKEK